MINLIFVLGCWLIYALIGVAWSKQVFSRGLFGFDLGYLLVAIVVSRIVVIKLEGISLRRNHWMLLFLSIAPGFALEALADYFLNGLRHRYDNGYVWAFVLLSILFLVFNLVWIVVFPGPHALDSRPSKEAIVYLRIVRWSGTALVGLVIVTPVWVMTQSGHLALGVQDGLFGLETWLYRLSVLVYLFLTARVMFPIWQMHPFGA